MSTSEFVTHPELELYVGQLTDHILTVDSKVESLRTEMHERFDRLERTQESTLDILQSIQDQLKEQRN